MGTLIGAGHPENVGENLFVEKAKAYLDDGDIIYWNRQVYGREFDVCILLREKCLLVVEVKGWREETILRVENNAAVVIQTEEGEKLATPQKQARSYRFLLERLIRSKTGRCPVVCHMVCLPQVTREYFRKKRLDVVIEERFTFLREDLEDNDAFFQKINQTLRETRTWHRAPFDAQMEREVRRLFESDQEAIPGEKDMAEEQEPAGLPENDYSRFYYIAGGALSQQAVDEMAGQYVRGCKLYGVFSREEQMRQVIGAMEAALTERGLVMDRGDIALDLSGGKARAAAPSGKSFTAFHCSFSLAEPAVEGVSSFCIVNGQCDDGQKALLRTIGGHSGFNAEQYFVEHAPLDKNIVIRAGAGTGKTYTMISRVGYICYALNVSPQKVMDQIAMITFTDDAAEQMEEKLKKYFQNCYMLTSRPEYLQLVFKVDHMQISTIHKFAKGLIAKLGTSFGYGVDVSITASEFYRRKMASDILDEYIRQKEIECGKDYPQKLGMPLYAVRDTILQFIEKLHNMNIDVSSLRPEDFGAPKDGASNAELHRLLADVIPRVEHEYSDELLESNSVYLGSMMSLLSRFISMPENAARIRALKSDARARRFMFVDEFQDTDDTQIEILLALARLMDHRLFVVGDIKQCIYRFRGAEEKAFDRLNIQDEPDEWEEFSLQRNYRTDKTLLELFDRSFSAWGASRSGLLAYTAERDRLTGTRDINGYLRAHKERFFRRIAVGREEDRIPALIEEIRRLLRRIQYEADQGFHLSEKDKSIAILVRENWQAEKVRTECAKAGITVQTDTGGDLYMSEPALDMLTLVNALVHFDEPEYLYSLLTSNFFSTYIPRSNLYEMRGRMRRGQLKRAADERELSNYLISYINPALVNMDGRDNKWEYVVTSLRTKPVLQVLRRLYNTLEPWRHYSREPWQQHYYQLNVDLLFEQMINLCNVDRLTINTLQERLYNCIVSRAGVDSRVPLSDKEGPAVQCITVHKAKGLEYGYVILPFCSAPIDWLRPSKLQVSTRKAGGSLYIGYSMAGEGQQTICNDIYNKEDEKCEMSREETRILYVAMTRAIRSFSWIELEGKNGLSWQKLIKGEV